MITVKTQEPRRIHDVSIRLTLDDKELAELTALYSRTFEFVFTADYLYLNDLVTRCGLSELKDAARRRLMNK